MVTKPIPDGYSAVTPYLFVDDGAAALDFYKAVFGAAERMRMDWGGGKIGHAEIDIGGSVIMLASEFPEMNALSPKTVGGTASLVMLYVESADDVFERAISHGAEIVRPLENQFYGDRSGTLRDPFGHMWTIATHVEDIDPEELQRRSEAMLEAAGER